MNGQEVALDLSHRLSHNLCIVVSVLTGLAISKCFSPTLSKFGHVGLFFFLLVFGVDVRCGLHLRFYSIFISFGTARRYDAAGKKYSNDFWDKRKYVLHISTLCIPCHRSNRGTCWHPSSPSSLACTGPPFRMLYARQAVYWFIYTKIP